MRGEFLGVALWEKLKIVGSYIDMKKIIILILPLWFSLSSCSKESDDIGSSLNIESSLIGTWDCIGRSEMISRCCDAKHINAVYSYSGQISFKKDGSVDISFKEDGGSTKYEGTAEWKATDSYIRLMALSKINSSRFTPVNILDFEVAEIKVDSQIWKIEVPHIPGTRDGAIITWALSKRK